MTTDGQLGSLKSLKPIPCGTAFGQLGGGFPLALHDNQTHYEPKDYYKVWYTHRKTVPEKLVNLKYIKQFGDAIQGHIDPQRLDWEEKLREFRYTGGYANFHLMRFSKGIYIDYFPKWGQYKDAPPSELVEEKFKKMSNDRYGQHEGVFEKQRPYVLFPLQMTAEKDLRLTLRYIKWATESKTYTIFKTHPCPGGGTHYDVLWSIAKRFNLLSEYTELVDGCRSHEMVVEADKIVSIDSGMNFKALMLDKPVCALRPSQMMNDIIPFVKVDNSILDVKAVPREDKLRWLNWFYNRVGIDFHDEDYADKLLHKLSRYDDQGLNDYEVHAW